MGVIMRGSNSDFFHYKITYNLPDEPNFPAWTSEDAKEKFAALQRIHIPRVKPPSAIVKANNRKPKINYNPNPAPTLGFVYGDDEEEDVDYNDEDGEDEDGGAAI